MTMSSVGHPELVCTLLITFRILAGSGTLLSFWFLPLLLTSTLPTAAARGISGPFQIRSGPMTFSGRGSTSTYR